MTLIEDQGEIVTDRRPVHEIIATSMTDRLVIFSAGYGPPFVSGYRKAIISRPFCFALPSKKVVIPSSMTLSYAIPYPHVDSALIIEQLSSTTIQTR